MVENRIPDRPGAAMLPPSRPFTPANVRVLHALSTENIGARAGRLTALLDEVAGQLEELSPETRAHPALVKLGHAVKQSRIFTRESMLSLPTAQRTGTAPREHTLPPTAALGSLWRHTVQRRLTTMDDLHPRDLATHYHAMDQSVTIAGYLPGRTPRRDPAGDEETPPRRIGFAAVQTAWSEHGLRIADIVGETARRGAELMKKAMRGQDVQSVRTLAEERLELAQWRHAFVELDGYLMVPEGTHRHRRARLNEASDRFARVCESVEAVQALQGGMAENGLRMGFGPKEAAQIQALLGAYLEVAAAALPTLAQAEAVRRNLGDRATGKGAKR